MKKDYMERNGYVTEEDCRTRVSCGCFLTFIATVIICVLVLGS